MTVVRRSVHIRPRSHYSDVIMSAMEAQIASVSIVCWPVGSGTDQRKNQSVASLAFVRRIHRWPMNSPHKRPVTRKMFSFNDVIMLFLSSGQLCNAFTPQLFLNYLPFKSGEKVYWSYQFSFIRHLWGPFFMYIHTWFTLSISNACDTKFSNVIFFTLNTIVLHWTALYTWSMEYRLWSNG